VVAIYLDATLPIPVVATSGSVVKLSTILTAAFGPSFGGYSNFWLYYNGATQLAEWDFSYWDPNNPAVAKWLFNGSDIGAQNEKSVSLGSVSQVGFQAGNNILGEAEITMPVAGPSGNWTEYIQYWIITIDPAVLSATAWTGDPTPADIVASAQRFAAKYVDVPNNNDCHGIASAVAAGAGATLTDASANAQDPTQNQEGGFWRIVYRGTDPNPVSDWQTLVQPGDIVRMGWASGGQHTTTVLAKNADGSIHVYDNDEYDSNLGTTIIDIHDANYYLDTDPSQITIYRLTPDHLYLINGSNGQVTGETLTGTIYSDVFEQISGNDTVNGGAGWNEAVLNIASTAATIQHANGSATVSYSGFTDTFNNVQVLKFTDKTVVLRTRAGSDFDDSGTSDVLFRNNSTGDTWFEAMSNGASAGWNQVGGSATNYSVVGEGHFYGDCASDILYRNNSTGDTWLEAMSNGAAQGWNQIGGSDTHYSAVAVGDFYGNGTDDILYRNGSTGDTWFVTMSAGNFAGWHQVGGSNTSYAAAGVGDFFGNGTDDILFRNNSTGDTWFEAMSNGNFAGWHQIGGSDTRYSIVGVGDFVGNGTSDILYRNNSTGDTWFEAMSNGNLAGWHPVGGSDTRFAVVGVGDYSGNGCDDILFRNNSTGDTWYGAMSNGNFTGWHQVGGSNAAYNVVA
jgi:hypothetical protein